jgi:hypothetical protein
VADTTHASTNTPLYVRDFHRRPLWLLGGAAALAALIAAASIASGVYVGLIGTVVVLLVGGAGFLTATTRLELTNGRVLRRSRARTLTYETASLVLERRGTSNVYVLAARDNARKVVCAFEDADADAVDTAFRAAGVDIAAPEDQGDETSDQ